MRDAEERGNKRPDEEEAVPTASFGAGGVGPGGQVGPYKLLKILGEGGYGIVYLAERQRPVKRRVALKVIKPGMDTKEVIARFEAERQALALLEHPNIAHVFNAGTTEAGRPYFVMEYVKGIPITDHCDRQKSTIEERLELFLSVCEAVQHAHQKGIIHRDIKPSNIQVSIQGEQAVAKVIDFGVAKALSQSLTERTLVTEHGQMVGTPEYMSPEQAEMTSQDIDTRSDIYSLGVVLYELLTGTLPFDPKTLREGGVEHIRRMIREEEPKTPSTRLSTISGEESAKVAQSRRTDLRTLGRKLHGDLDWITLKAMEKDRTRRYQTAHALAEDIQRHLNSEPVLAGPPSKIYRLKKFIRKHRTQAIGTAVAGGLLAVIAVISVLLFQAMDRNREAKSVQHTNILSKAMEYRSKGQYEDALAELVPILNSEHVGPEARLLRARLVLELQGPAEAVRELQKLTNERDEIAGQAHFHLAKIYYESDPDAPGRTEQYRLKWEHHRQEAERLLPQTADAYLLRAMSAGTVPKTLDLLNKALELDNGRHYDSLRERAYLSYAGKNYYKMAKDAAKMTAIQPNNPLGYSLSAIAQRELKQFDEAMEDHNKAIKLLCDEAELYDQRRRTQMQMGNYEKALSDAKACVRLRPDERMYHFHVFCALVALGRYDEAKVKYDTIIKSGLMEKWRFHLLTAKYVSDTLAAGLSWHPPESKPEGAAFLAMHESAEIYRQLAKKADRVVSEGFHPNWSPDGTELCCSRGVLGSSGIEILNLGSGKTRLLTTPGKDPKWSPDGKYIVYVRDRQVLPLGRLTTEHGGEHGPILHEEVWFIKADGTEEPRFLARGGWASWSSDSKRVFYHSRVDVMLCSISIENGAKPTPIIRCPYYYPAVSPDEKYVAYSVGSELHILEISSSSIIARWLVPREQRTLLLNWSPNDMELAIGGFGTLGFWIYDLKTKKPSKLLGGSFGWCSWSPTGDKMQIAITRPYGNVHHEIWVADATALGPGRTIEQHCREMVDFYTRRIKTDPADAEYYFSRARVYIFLEDKEKAFADLERYADLVKKPSEAAAAYDTLAWPLVCRPQEMVNPEILVDLYQKTHQMQPDNWLYLTGLGVAHYRAGQWEEAISALTRSTELPAGENTWNFLFLSMAHWQLGNKAIAANWYNKTIRQMRKDNIDSLLTTARHDLYLEAAELMGIKTKELYRKAPLTGKQILPVMARADSSHSNMTEEHIVDGAGLADRDGDGLLEHDENPENMWLSGEGQTTGWIEFDLRGVYELGSILVWNYNVKGDTKRGINRADISVWMPEAGWQKTFDDFGFTEAEGSFDYDEPILVRFDGVKAQRVRFDDFANFSDERYVGLSEVQFFQRRGPEAITPYPVDGAEIGVPKEAKLSWTPGVGVKAHKVYFGTDADSLKYMGRFDVGDPNEVKLPTLEKLQRYWWRVDAEKSDGSTIKGKLWSFSTGRMVGWWKFDKTEGQIAVDSSGSGLDGKLVGDAQIISDPARGNVLSLDGDGDYVNCGKNPAFDLTDEITVAAWVNITTVPTDWTAIVTKGDSAWRLLTVGDERRFHFAITPGATGHYIDGDIEVPASQWHHVCATYDGSYIRLYVDGVEDSRSPVRYGGSINTNAWEVLIGANARLPGHCWNGLIDDVRIYSYALSEAEIKAVYARKK